MGLFVALLLRNVIKKKVNIFWFFKYLLIIKLLIFLIVYEGGRHLIGPFNYFINFPRNLQTIEFSSYKSASG